MGALQPRGNCSQIEDALILTQGPAPPGSLSQTPAFQCVPDWCLCPPSGGASEPSAVTCELCAHACIRELAVHGTRYHAAGLLYLELSHEMEGQVLKGTVLVGQASFGLYCTAIP